MIRLQCPRCGANIAPLSAEWQAQRSTPDKFCPHCQAPVKAVINAKKFGRLGACFAIPGAVLFGFLPSELPGLTALMGAIMAGTLALLPSIHLQARELQRPAASGQLAARPSLRRPRWRWLRHALGLLVLACLLKIASDYTLAGAREFKLHLTASGRPSVVLDLGSLDGLEDEAALHRRFELLQWACYDKLPNTLGERNCYADVSAVNGVEAMALAMHFNQGRLQYAVVQFPPWRWRTMRRWMLDTHGLPHASQRAPVQGVRLLGWRLPNGHAVFLNRDQSWNLFEPVALMWSRSDACGGRPCISDTEPAPSE